ncbi:hypothetical protein PVAP13_2NG519303 [Panicum virgatum]|uniref:Uncharacterized protein n=1 Tax=Panicum virgatum TaxID=38727 RepID=A0A8T0VRK7_PANVG|nr:hypothetical protein PVAP13_2NG519303 [Panicum virgatum]
MEHYCSLTSVPDCDLRARSALRLRGCDAARSISQPRRPTAVVPMPTQICQDGRSFQFKRLIKSFVTRKGCSGLWSSKIESIPPKE